MSKRVNLPYTTQDLFPQPAATPSSLRMAGASTRTGSIVSNQSSMYVPRPTLNYGWSSTSSSAPSSIASRLNNIKTMIKRLFKPKTLDFETAIWEIFHLIINPRKMYRSHYFYKQQQLQQDMFSRNSYSRDDPSFLILLTGFLSISAIAWGVAYLPGVLDIFKLIVYMVLVDFYLTGIVIATVTWLFMNRLFNDGIQFSKYNVNYVSWGFCFDIHCNSFLIIWCLLYVVQFILLPVIRIKGSVIALVIGNLLYFGSIGYYFVVSFYGFNSLPFISANFGGSNSLTGKRSPARTLQLVVIAGVLPLLAVGWLITLVFGFNVADSMVDTYFN
ncbi:Protein GMH1 [Candida viswanathii]|uniref:Protein GMH1 n=1 Tax=Candida viswanathii TaxID=5486 RepID=A0A367YCA5_9ASCO|nr:Protein GMH1 [Candida viswanathii]